MAMKYVKLFEHWLLTEAQVKGFDKAKPGNWPVLETKIKDAVTADFSGPFLKSIFERSISEGNRSKFNVLEGSIKNAPVTLDIKKMYDDKVKKNTDLKKTLEDFVGFLTQKSQNYFVENSFEVKQKSIDTLYAYFQECIENLRKPNEKTEFIENPSWKKIFYSVQGLVSDPSSFTKTFKKDKASKCILFVEELKKELEKNKKVAESQKIRIIPFFWDDKPIFKLICDPDIAKGGDPEDGIINFKCKELAFDMKSYIDDPENSGEFLENEFYKQIDGESMSEIDSSDITFGQVMSWLNVWQKGKSNPELLSTTGKDAYADACKEIFGPEEAASLPAFASASVKIGDKTVTLANSKSDGTIVPVLAFNKVVGTVGFAYNSYEISETGLKSLKEKDIWDALSKANSSIIIVGNTDGSGPDDYNKKLSLQRAEAVLAVLSKDPRFAKLKATKNVTTRGDGKKNPLEPDDKGKNQEAAASNRRVELIIDGQEASDKLKK